MRRGENRQLHAQGRELEDLKSRLRVSESRAKTEFDWLHQKRAEAAVEVYSLLIEMDRQLQEAILDMKLTDVATIQDQAAALKEFRFRGFALQKRYSELGLLLPESILESLENLYQDLTDNAIKAVKNASLNPNDFSDVFDGDHFRHARRAISDVRAALRKALGDVADEARVMRGGNP